MLLCICFSGESIPFILDMATEDEVLRAISMCKRMFDIDDRNYTVESDRIILHARKRNNPPKKRKRLYCWNDKIILQTPADYPDEVEPTRELLANERCINLKDICVVEI